jgi:hypothetical protein
VAFQLACPNFRLSRQNSYSYRDPINRSLT